MGIIAGTLWTILPVFSLPEKWGISQEMAKTNLDTVGTILIGFGILGKPADKANFYHES